MEPKKLYRDQSSDKMLGGVCSGLAKYFSIDPSIVRLAFVALALLGGPGIVLYIIMLIVVPPEPLYRENIMQQQPVDTPTDTQ